MAPPHPLRRVSTGSLSSLARSQSLSQSQDGTSNIKASPSGLDFLAPALTDLADEASSLAENVAKLNEMHDALGTFNEAFSSFLYALKMNAFCVEWTEQPGLESFTRMKIAEEAARQAQQTAQSLISSSARPSTSGTSPAHPASSLPIDEADLTYATAFSFDDPPPNPVRKSSMKHSSDTGVGPSAMRKSVAPGAGARGSAGSGGAAGIPATAAERRKRDLEVAGYIDLLPLDYRGNDPTMRVGMEKVIKKLMSRPDGYTLQDMIAPPDLPQAKANKHLMALVQRKLVVKLPSPSGKAVYQWVGA